MKMTLSTRNARGVVANVLGAADVRAQRAARVIVKKYGTRQHKLTRELAPVKTGFLRSQIVLRISDDGLAYEVGLREADFEQAGLSFYALFQEFGTRHMRAQPFVFPARDEVYPEFRADLSATLRRAWARRGVS